VDKKQNSYPFVLSALLTAASVHAAVPDIGTRRELFVDDYLVETMTGCELRLPTPYS
jgi:hypothetical protein